MFNNEQMSDVHFIVGPPGETQRVPAHKVPEPTWAKVNLRPPEMPRMYLDSWAITWTLLFNEA